MRAVTIIGAGQSGMQLAIGLKKSGYDVNVITAQSPEQVASGRVTSSQCMFDTALQHERDIGIDYWADTCPPIEGIAFTLTGPDGAAAVRWGAKLDRPAMSVDQRVKMPALMREFQALGGDLSIQEIGLNDLESAAKSSELVVVAAGKGAITNIFERDAERSTFDKPMRALGLTYVKGLLPRSEYSAVSFSLIPGVGEYFVFPALTATGPCDIMVFEGVPGGPLDCWQDVRAPEEHLKRSLEILAKFVPWERERANSVELTDPNAILSGRFAPTVRQAVARLPSGAIVLGMGDVVCLNDPITGQGSNNASKCAAVYQKSILARGREPFDGHWMRSTFDGYWDYARWVVDWTNKMLLPPAPHVVGLLVAAATKPEVARWFVNAFDDPRRFYPRLTDPAEAEQFIATAA